MSRIAIIGGGISGLAAAFALEKKRRDSAPVQYALYESGPRLGGVIQTEDVEGCVVEAGPDSFLTEKPWASDLCREIGIEDQLITSNDSHRKTYILLNDELIPLPHGLLLMIPTRIMAALRSPLFSTSTKLRMGREWFHAPHRSKADESVASFVERHYGREVVDRVADPLLQGVYGGDADQLSARSVLPRLVAMEENHGSLSRGMLAAQKQRREGASTSPLFTSLKEGMQQMVDALARELPSNALRLNSRVQLIQQQDSGWLVSAGYGTDHFDGVIIALPSPAAAEILHNDYPRLAAELQGIQYGSSVTVTLAYERNVRDSLPPGFGILIPRNSGKRLLAVTFVHNKFPHRAPEDRALIRCFLGGTRDEAVLQLAEDEILQIVRTELEQILRISAEPVFTRVFKWNGAMAQYNVGHGDRIESKRRLLAQVPGVALAGNGYSGIGVPDCIRSGYEAADQVLSALGIGVAKTQAAGD